MSEMERAIWVDEMMDLFDHIPAGRFMSALETSVRESKWLPTPAEIQAALRQDGPVYRHDEPKRLPAPQTRPPLQPPPGIYAELRTRMGDDQSYRAFLKTIWHLAPDLQDKKTREFLDAKSD